VLILIAVLAGGYFYHTASAVCDVPIAYRIGELDDSFNLSEGEARAAITDAESLWEDATGRNLFSYDEEAVFTVNFIFDARQAQTDKATELGDRLAESRSMSEEVKAEYENLLTKYEALADAYQAKRDRYETDLAAYNAEVEKWNKRGGAPEEVYQELDEQQKELQKTQQELNSEGHQLNDIVAKINELGERGNVLVSAYNNVVNLYNNTFGKEREFTQGDYQGKEINIYQFSDGEELRLVLAHEMGHALGLDHVTGSTSVMHYLMGDQSLRTGLTDADKEEFTRVCGTGEFTWWPFRW